MRAYFHGLVGFAAAIVAAPTSAEYVTSDALNCRSAPTTSSSVVTRLTRNEEVRILARSGDWARVDPRRTTPCWAATRYLGLTRVAASSANSPRGTSTRSSTQQSLVRPAQRSNSRAQSRRSSTGTGSSCPCSGSRVCIGPRGGRYCMTSGGNRRYGV